MIRASTAFLCLVTLGWLAAGCARPKPTLVPPQTTEMDAHTLKKFQEEIEEYVELRKKVLEKLPPIGEKATPEEVTAHQRALTQAIVAYRKGKEQGDMFKGESEAAIRRVLQRELSGPDGPSLIKEIKQGNPRVEGNPQQQNPTREVRKEVVVAVNAIYPDGAPFSSVPPSLLLRLPPLPEQVRYRFVGRALILRDTEANVVLDFIADVVPDRSIPR